MRGLAPGAAEETGAAGVAKGTCRHAGRTARTTAVAAAAAEALKLDLEGGGWGACNQRRLWASSVGGGASVPGRRPLPRSGARGWFAWPPIRAGGPCRCASAKTRGPVVAGGRRWWPAPPHPTRPRCEFECVRNSGAGRAARWRQARRHPAGSRCRHPTARTRAIRASAGDWAVLLQSAPAAVPPMGRGGGGASHSSLHGVCQSLSGPQRYQRQEKADACREYPAAMMMMPWDTSQGCGGKLPLTRAQRRQKRRADDRRRPGPVWTQN